jgi:hypothetical protein
MQMVMAIMKNHDNDKCSNNEKDEFDAPNKVIVQNHKDYRIEVDCKRLEEILKSLPPLDIPYFIMIDVM